MVGVSDSLMSPKDRNGPETSRPSPRTLGGSVRFGVLFLRGGGRVPRVCLRFGVWGGDANLRAVRRA